VERDLAEKHTLSLDDHPQVSQHLLALYAAAVDDILNDATPRLQELGAEAAPCCNPYPQDKPCYSNTSGSNQSHQLMLETSRDVASSLYGTVLERFAPLLQDSGSEL
jgi:hypothetical protein